MLRCCVVIMSVLLLFFSCSKSLDKKCEETIITIMESDSLLPLNKFVESTKIVHLETPDSNFISSFEEAVITNNNIYVLDIDLMAIFMYDTVGHYIKKLQKTGRAGDEYLYIEDWTFDGENFYLLEGEKILVYTSELDYHSTINITPIINEDSTRFWGADRIVAYNNFLLLFDNNNKKVHSLKYNNDAGIFESKMILEDERMCSNEVGISTSERVFYKYNNNMIVIPSGSDCVYMLDKDLNHRKVAIIDYEDKEKRYSILLTDAVREYDVRIQNEPKRIGESFCVGEDIFFDYPSNKGGGFFRLNVGKQDGEDFLLYQQGKMDDYPYWDCGDGSTLYGFYETSLEEQRNGDKPKEINGVELRNVHNCDEDILQYLVIHKLH